MMLSPSKSTARPMGLGTIRSLAKAPAGYYIATGRGYLGPYRGEGEARAALPRRVLGGDGELPSMAEHIVWWAGPTG